MNLNLNLKPYVRRTDESGHIYFIPANEAAEYDALNTAIVDCRPATDQWYSLIGQFEDKYTKYRLGGSDYGLIMWINPDEL